jgi:hypothetical protein
LPITAWNRHAQGLQHLPHRTQLGLGAVFGQVSDHQTKLGPRFVRADAGAHLVEPGGAPRALKVRIIDNDESKGAAAPVAGEAAASGPKAQWQQRARAAPELLTAVYPGVESAVQEWKKRHRLTSVRADSIFA